MNWLRLLPLFLLGGANIAIAGLVMTRDFRKVTNRAFAGFVLGIGVWVIGIAGFLLSQNQASALLWARIYYFAPLLIAVSGYFFARSFPSEAKLRSRLLYPLLIPFVLLTAILLFQPDYFTKRLIYHSWGKEVLLGQPVYAIYTIYILLFFAIILWGMYRKSLRLRGIYAQQARLFFQTLTIAAVFGMLFNLLLPLFHNYRLIGLGPLFTSISVLGIGYSIARHRMFDIRLVIARALGYASSLVVLAALYGFIVFGIANLLFDLQLSLMAQVYLSAATGLAALSFQRIKSFFDKGTNAIFYRDGYDVQELFDQLNKVLVSSLDVHYLMSQSISVIETALKPSYALIGLRKNDDDEGYRLFSSQEHIFRQVDIDRVRHLTLRVHRKVIVADYLDDAKYRELKELMLTNNVAVIVRLAQDVRRTQEGLGYLVLGNKRSGNPYTEQDIQALDTVANELFIAIQNALHYEEIQQFNEVLQSRVDDATRKLRRTNEKLKALDETKDDFISMASHQLRTPLTSVKGYLSMVLEEDAGKINATQQKMLGQAFVSSQRMVYLIADLLNVSRLKTGKFVIERTPTNLATMIDEELAQLTETAASRNITLTYRKPKDFPALPLDETKTRQVIMNFVDNAIYYTPAGGHIAVELVDNPTSVELRVVDDGIGVPAHEQHHLFTKFYRARNAQKARPDGTGLGLFMAKKVVIAQGGSVIFESAEGKGSTFGFLFPKPTPVKPAKLPVAKIKS